MNHADTYQRGLDLVNHKIIVPHVAPFKYVSFLEGVQQ